MSVFLTILAYIIVLVLGQFAFSISLMILMAIYGMILYVLPERIKVPIGMFAAGASAGFITVLFAYFVFKLSKFGVLPYIASVISVVPPMITDYRKSKEYVIQRDMIDQSSPTYSMAASMALGEQCQLVGTLIGLVLGGWWFL